LVLAQAAEFGTGEQLRRVGLNCRKSENNQGEGQNRHPFKPNKGLTEGIGKQDFNAV